MGEKKCNNFPKTNYEFKLKIPSRICTKVKRHSTLALEGLPVYRSIDIFKETNLSVKWEECDKSRIFKCQLDPNFCCAESQTIEDFGAALHLMRADLEHLRSVFMAVENGDLGMLKSIGIKDSELGDVKFFLEKLVNTGFLD